jgi:hypothetical protein
MNIHLNEKDTITARDQSVTSKKKSWKSKKMQRIGVASPPGYKTPRIKKKIISRI